jgi:hypothetical protein
MNLITTEADVRRDIAKQGFAWIPRTAWALGQQLEPLWHRLCEDWDHLEPDRYLEHGAMFRLRRYGRYSWSPAQDVLAPLPHEPYFQPQDENVYAGGIVRNFAPTLPETTHNPFLHALVRSTFACLPVAAARQDQPWEVRVHQIRIVSSPGKPGLPAPEGIHQDGTDFLTLHLVRRRNVVGGTSTIYDLDYQPKWNGTLREALDSLILEDPRVLHAVTPVRSADGRTVGVRDILGLDFLYLPDRQPPAGLP